MPRKSPIAGAPDTPFGSQLRARSRARREGLARLAAPAAAPHPVRNDLLPRLQLVQRAVDGLVMPARNVRALDPAHLREVAAAISVLGFCDPILIDEHGTVLDGAVRLAAARSLGLAAVPCIRADHLDATERRLLRLALNRLGETGGWDFDALKLELGELIMDEAPIEITGFTLAEVDQIRLAVETPVAEPGELEPAPGARAIARRGESFALGPHRVICGDATDPAVLATLMGEEQARLVLTDEPYNVPIAGHVTGGAHREFVMASGEMSDAEFQTFNRDWMTACLPHLLDGGLFATFIDWRGCPTVDAAARALDLIPINLIVWAKTNGGMGSLYRSQHELLPLYKKGAAPHINNVALGKHGRWRSNLWTYPGASSLGSEARKGLHDHPTVKPVAMLEDALLDVTARGDIVLDPFLGSGSTLIAAETTGRRCRGIEIDPLYVDVILRRFEAITGVEAILESTGETFAALTAVRDPGGAAARRAADSEWDDED